MGVAPTSPQLLVGRVAHVTDETSDAMADGSVGTGRSDDADLLDDHLLDDDTMDTIAEAERAMADVKARLADVPAEVVVTNHVMGLYELAAIHLSSSPPDLVQAALAIDAVACLVDGLGDRLGEDFPTMRDALNNIRLAFVQIKSSTADV